MSKRIDASQAQCLVFTFKDGVMQRLAHDLELRVGSFSLDVDGEQSVRAQFDAASIVTVTARKDGAPDPTGVSDSDKKTIDEIVRKEVLDVAKHPTITFASTKVTPQGASWLVEGALTIKGKSKTISVPVRREGNTMVTEIDLDQREFDIKPYSAMLGTLRLQPVLKVRLSVPA